MNLNQKQFNSLAAGIIIVVTILVYSNSFRVPFQFDDIYHITQKQTIQDLKNFSRLSDWTGINTRPLPMFTLALNFRWGGVNPVGYHLFNLIIHILAGWIVYLLTLQILSLKNLKIGKTIQENRQYFALLAGLLFVVHPMQTQAVTYIIQRITVLSSLFYLLSVYYYIKGRSIHIETGELKKYIIYYALTVVSFVLALLSKQIAVTLPLALILAEVMFIRDREGKIQKKYLLIVSASVAAFIIIGLVSYGLPRETKDISRHVYLLTSLKVLVKYIQMFILPIRQNLDHDIKPSETLFGGYELVSLAILAGLIFLAVKMFRKNPLISFGIFWFFITLLVEQSVIPIRDFMFEHRFYLPGFGLMISALAALFTYLPMINYRKLKIPASVAVALLLVIAYGITAYARNNVWKSDVTLWSDAAKKSPNKGRPFLWLGIAYSTSAKYDQARASLDESIKLMPSFPMGYFNRGNVYKETGDYEASLKDYDQAIKLDPKYTLAYFNRGVVKAKLGRYSSAIEDYSTAIKRDKRSANTYYNRGNAFRNLGKYKEAISDYDEAIKLDPKYTLAYFNRGLSKAGLKKHTEAIKDFDIALGLDQKNHLIYNGKGVSLYALKRYKEAIANYDAALRIKPGFGQAYYNRAFAKFMGLKDSVGGCSDWRQAEKLNYKGAGPLVKKYCENIKTTAPKAPKDKKSSPGKKKK